MVCLWFCCDCAMGEWFIVKSKQSGTNICFLSFFQTKYIPDVCQASATVLWTFPMEKLLNEFGSLLKGTEASYFVCN